MSHVGIASMGFMSSTDYYLSGIIVSTDKATYICGDMVEASAVLYSGNLTVANYPVSMQIVSPLGHVSTNTSLSDEYGIARFSLLLPAACEIGVYTITTTSQGQYNSANAEDKISVSPTQNYINLDFDKVWYDHGEPVDLTGRLVTNCNLTIMNHQEVQLEVIGPDKGFLTSASTRTTGPIFTLAFMLPESALPGLYEVVMYVLDPCRNDAIYANAFFSVLSNMPIQPWAISVALDKSMYEIGDQIVMAGMVTGGPYFFCQLGWACTGNGTFPPIDVSIHVISANGTEVYSRTMNIGLYYYPPVYEFQEVFSGYVHNSYLIPGTYVIIAEASTEGYPTVQAATSFTVA
jgi:uncharacterized protein YfaS (alpha-2-macroglobulin family)